MYKAVAVYHVQLKTHILRSRSLPDAVLEDAIVEATCAQHTFNARLPRATEVQDLAMQINA